MTEQPKPRHIECPQCGEFTLVFDFDHNGELYELCTRCDYTTLEEPVKLHPMADDPDIPFLKGQ